MSRQGQYDAKHKKQARINWIRGLAMSTKDEMTGPGRREFSVQSNTRGEFSADYKTNGEFSVDSGLVASVAAAITYDDGLKAVTFSRIRKETESDTEMQQLNKAIQDCPAEENFPLNVAQYNRYREALSVLDGVPMYGRRVIIPAGLRSEVLQCLHSGHQGT